jgi:hypothetical protein
MRLAAGSTDPLIVSRIKMLQVIVKILVLRPVPVQRFR